ncbi:hypothetical protein AVEN_178569-1 [Araneus ventricosus]|uniref:Uncharacterized protein n=1 Tax=Araneus ventricosus TaxID=182803 RepID=A0A4Y2FJQ6_ARAVE|nr:hypothetical protein AVEN_178569-1 [Araneus ventricosus]
MNWSQVPRATTGSKPPPSNFPTATSAGEHLTLDVRFKARHTHAISVGQVICVINIGSITRLEAQRQQLGGPHGPLAERVACPARFWFEGKVCRIIVEYLPFQLEEVRIQPAVASGVSLFDTAIKTHHDVVTPRFAMEFLSVNTRCLCRHGKSLPSNASLMVGKRVLQGEAWSDLSDSYGTHDLGDKLGDHFGDLGDK